MKYTAILALTLCGLTCQAQPVDNGLYLANALTTNGFTINGAPLNGIHYNPTPVNHIKWSGIKFNGLGFKGLKSSKTHDTQFSGHLYPLARKPLLTRNTKSVVKR